MKYEIGENFIKIFSKDEFNIEHILECGQVFCFKKEGENYIVFPENKYAEIIENKNFYLIKTNNPQYFVNWFDLENDYSGIKKALSCNPIMENSLKFGYGIRILKQDLFETLISFIISANNNITRIKMILNNIRSSLGEKVGEKAYSFPSFEKLSEQNEEFFKTAGAGYRAGYLVKVLKQITPQLLKEWENLSTLALRTKLIELAGVGPKVADCILLFGYNRGDVFPVDTWIEKMYNLHFPALTNREKIRDNLVEMFGSLSGYAQQYLFYYQRSGK